MLHPRDSFFYNDNSGVVVEKHGDDFFQVAYKQGKETTARKFEIGFGSGEKASSFGYWLDKKVYQLPLSYFASIKGWANSPGYPLNAPFFQRPIIGRCFECHSSYISESAEQVDDFSNVRNLDASTLIYGIDCERCHGPAAEHVSFHEKNPSVKEAHSIMVWKSLSRQQKLDACGICHSGNDLGTQRPTFAFKPGDNLSDFYFPSFETASDNPDVHGKQVQLLAASRCFQQSKTLECGSCHNTHEPATTNLTVYAQQCKSCHNGSSHKICPKTSLLGEDILQNKCIDCHMPFTASRKISFQVAGKETIDPYLLRTHRIAVYSEEAEKIIATLKGINVQKRKGNNKTQLIF